MKKAQEMDWEFTNLKDEITIKIYRQGEMREAFGPENAHEGWWNKGNRSDIDNCGRITLTRVCEALFGLPGS